MQEVVLGTSGLSFADVIAVARHGAKVSISEASLSAMAETRAHIEKLAAGDEPVYGISTGQPVAYMILPPVTLKFFMWRPSVRRKSQKMFIISFPER